MCAQPPPGEMCRISRLIKHLTVRISDDLHAKAMRVARGSSLAGFVREAIAEKVGRAEARTRADADDVRDADALRRIEALEREVEQLKQRLPPR